MSDRQTVAAADESQLWVRGDIFDLDIPATAEALGAGGEAFLTRAFIASGAMTGGNSVSRITDFEVFSGGGTGSKLQLSVAYEKDDPNLPCELFVKFSRNFSDPIRDRVRYMLQPEIEFAVLSRGKAFPITVAQCLFADFHRESGTGILITERIPFGRGGIEPHYIKCMDHLLPEPVAHYQAIMRTLGTLAGSHKAGQLPEDFYHAFPFDLAQAVGEDPLRYRAAKLTNRLSRLQGFTQKHPQLLPDHVCSETFFASFVQDVLHLEAVESQLRHRLFDVPDFIALCHWNANIDNAWFWRKGNGDLDCGLLDWGAVGQMSVAKSIYGAFSGAGTDLWDHHLDTMLITFIEAYVAAGGVELDLDRLRNHVLLFAGLMGVAYLLDAPAIIERSVPALDHIRGPMDPALLAVEDARVQLHMLTMFLNLWQRRDIGSILRACVP